MPTNKQRHGCLSVFLFFLVFIFFRDILVDLTFGRRIIEKIHAAPAWMLPVSILLSVCGLICVYLLLHWEKTGVYGIVAISLMHSVFRIAFKAKFVAIVMPIIIIAILISLVYPHWEQFD